jgi:hypothetical protein
LRIARVVARDAVILLFVFLALSPATVLAFNPPDPNSPGHHHGEYLHNRHLQTSQPLPGGGSSNNNGGGDGIHNAFGVLKSGAAGPSPEALPAFHIQRTGLVVPQLTAESKAGLDAWWVVVLLAAVIAANVVLAVVYVSRGGNYVVRRILRPLPATA